MIFFFSVLTESFFSVLMDISKNQWRSTGGYFPYLIDRKPLLFESVPSCEHFEHNFLLSTLCSPLELG